MTTSGRFASAVLRGYGQLFLCNNAGSGVWVLAGFCCLSPALAGWSLLAAALVTAGAWVCRVDHEAESGLFSVNGAVLGLSWGLLPEVSVWAKVVLTLLGAALIVLALVGWLRVCHSHRWSFTLLALPGLAAVWLNVAVAQAAGWYDVHALRGWSHLAANQPREAAAEFAQVNASSSRMGAYQHAGWGWAAYLEGQHTLAAERFREARRLDPTLADAMTGGGWAALRLREVNEARGLLEAAIASDPGQADAWDGLGWIAWQEGDPQAGEYFEQCLLRLPLLADAHQGRAQTLAGSDPAAAKRHAWLGAFAQRLSPPWQRTSSRQWLCWLLFFMGILWHSRTSALVVAASLGMWLCLLVLAGRQCPGLSDAGFLFNLLPSCLALGSYVRLTARSVAWVACLGMLLAASWPFLSSSCLGLGLPVQSWPFHVGLLGTLLVWRQFRATRDLVVPLEFAITTPEAVHLWEAKQTLANACWRLLHEQVAG